MIGLISHITDWSAKSRSELNKEILPILQSCPDEEATCKKQVAEFLSCESLHFHSFRTACRTQEGVSQP